MADDSSPVVGRVAEMATPVTFYFDPACPSQQPHHRPTEHIACTADERRPDCGTECVEEEEPADRHCAGADHDRPDDSQAVGEPHADNDPRVVAMEQLCHARGGRLQRMPTRNDRSAKAPAEKVERLVAVHDVERAELGLGAGEKRESFHEL